jgi:hypothetical protein
MKQFNWKDEASAVVMYNQVSPQINEGLQSDVRQNVKEKNIFLANERKAMSNIEPPSVKCFR